MPTIVDGTTGVTFPAGGVGNPAGAVVGTTDTQTLTNKTLTTPIVSTTMGVGGATPSGSGSGITFPATQSASSDANTLDDYEEGTWTPTDTSGAGLSFTGVVAQYVKVGSMLVAQMSITYPSTANGNQAAIGGLPFTTANFDNAGGFNRYGTNAAYIFPTLSANGTSGSLFTIGGTGVSNVSLSLKRIDLTYVYRTT